MFTVYADSKAVTVKKTAGSALDAAFAHRRNNGPVRLTIETPSRLVWSNETRAVPDDVSTNIQLVGSKIVHKGAFLDNGRTAPACTGKEPTNPKYNLLDDAITCKNCLKAA